VLTITQERTMSEQLESAIDVDAVLNELEALVETLHACSEEYKAKRNHEQWSAYKHSLELAYKTQAAITRLVLNDLTVTTKE
jgi:uncharacterized protein with HEPN domain